MRDPLDRYRPGISFWKITPQLADVSPFRKLHDDDVSEGKEYSSKVMWWIVRVWHLTHNNVLREELAEVRMAKASEALFNDERWHDKKTLKKMLDALKGGWDMLKTLAQRDLELAREHHQQRNVYMATLNYKNQEQRAEIDKMSPKTGDILKNIAKLEEQVRLEQGEFEEEEDEDESGIESGKILA